MTPYRTCIICSQEWWTKGGFSYKDLNSPEGKLIDYFNAILWDFSADSYQVLDNGYSERKNCYGYGFRWLQ